MGNLYFGTLPLRKSTLTTWQLSFFDQVYSSVGVSTSYCLQTAWKFCCWACKCLPKPHYL